MNNKRKKLEMTSNYNKFKVAVFNFLINCQSQKIDQQSTIDYLFLLTI
jgi:hypothetical protein